LSSESGTGERSTAGGDPEAEPQCRRQTAGPPPYSIYWMVPSKAFGLPGMFGMDKFDRADLPKPTRWDFGGS
jgi:hypothetical protein